MKYKIICPICNKINYRNKWEKSRIYCSQKCYGIAQRKLIKDICSIEDCNSIVYAFNYCSKHYQRFKRHEDPNYISPPKIFTIKCTHCHIPFLTYKSYKRYCSRKCVSLHKSASNIKMCLCCGTSFHPTHKINSKYCSTKCSHAHRKKPYIINKGYKRLLLPSHHKADSKGYVYEHILVLEKKLDRLLKPNEVTHHIDENKLNNNPSNLTVCINNTFHLNQYHNIRK